MLSWWSLVRSRLIALVWFVCCLISSWRDPRLSWFLAKVNLKPTVLSAMYKLVLRTFFQISEWSISNRGAMCCESNVSIDMDTSYLYMIHWWLGHIVVTLLTCSDTVEGCPRSSLRLLRDGHPSWTVSILIWCLIMPHHTYNQKNRLKQLRASSFALLAMSLKWFSGVKTSHGFERNRKPPLGTSWIVFWSSQ